MSFLTQILSTMYLMVSSTSILVKGTLHRMKYPSIRLDALFIKTGKVKVSNSFLANGFRYFATTFDALSI